MLALVALSTAALAVSAAETGAPEPQTDRAPGTRGDILDRDGTTSAPLVRQIIGQTLLDKLPSPERLDPYPGPLDQVTAGR